MFLVYIETNDSWDADKVVRVYPNAEFWEDDYNTTSIVKYRKFGINKQLIGVVTDSHTYQVLLLRAEPYARKYEDKTRAENQDKSNYKVTTEYVFEKVRHVVIPPPPTIEAVA